MSDRNKILAKIKEIVLSQAPEAKVYLYGSRVRGEARTDSDWDILILLNTRKITPVIEQKITHPLYYLEIDTGEVISPMVYSDYEWNTKYKVTPFYRSVMQEGELL